MLELNRKRVLVIGGGTGIGLATARLANELGARVTIASRSLEKLAAAAALIGRNVDYHSLDLLSNDEVESFFFDRDAWDHIIVTGSEVSVAPVRDLPLDTAVEAFNSKFWGFYRVAKEAKINEGGSLSVVAGFLATRPVAGRALMGAINAALESLVRGLALELAPVRVNGVSPAVVTGGMWSHMSEADQAAMYERVGSGYPAGRVGAPEEIARQLLLLADIGYATGTIVTLDGGASIA